MPTDTTIYHQQKTFVNKTHMRPLPKTTPRANHRIQPLTLLLSPSRLYKVLTCRTPTGPHTHQPQTAEKVPTLPSCTYNQKPISSTKSVGARKSSSKKAANSLRPSPAHPGQAPGKRLHRCTQNSPATALKSGLASPGHDYMSQAIFKARHYQVPLTPRSKRTDFRSRDDRIKTSTHTTNPIQKN